MKGRKPVPTKTLKFRGSKQAKGRGCEPQVEAEFPSPPAWLSAFGKREWAWITKHARALGYIAKLDRSVLALYCEALGQFVAARKEDRQTAMRDWSDRTVKYAAELGFTPVSRARCKVIGEVKKPTDDKARFVKFG